MNLDDLLMGLRNERLRQRVPERTRKTRDVSTRRGTAIQNPSRSSVPSRSASPRPGQAAIDFGRSFTGGNGPGADAVDRLSREVFANLSGKGLYKDPSGSWQIRGQERPDVTRRIRDAAVASMGGPDWSRLVQQSEQNIVGGLSTKSPGMSKVPGAGGNVPSPGLGGVPSTPTRGVPSPGLGGTPLTPAGATRRGPWDPEQGRISQASQGSVPQPGLGGVPTVPPPPPSGMKDLSGLGASIAGQVKSKIGQAQAPSTGSIQATVEAALRSRGLTPPTGGPLTPGRGQVGPQAIPGPVTVPPAGSMPMPQENWPKGPVSGPPTSGPRTGPWDPNQVNISYPKQGTQITQYPNPSTRQGTSSTTAQPGGTQTPVTVSRPPMAGTGGVPLPPGMSQGPLSREPIPAPQPLPPGMSQGTPSIEPTMGPQALPPGMSQGTPSTAMGIAAPGSTGMGGYAGTDAATSNIIQQETGGAQWTPNNVNCQIRAPDCLDLNTGIFKSTADSMGLDWNRLMTDPSYAPQAVGTLLNSYANDDAGKWGGPSGMTVFQYGEQNLPGGGWEAVARIYFGGDITGQFVDEQGRSGVQYGQEFVAKMGGKPVQSGTMTGNAQYSSPQMNVAAPGAGTSGMGVGAPQGTIPTDLNLAYGRGDDWSQVNQYDPLFVKYGQQYGVDPAVLKAIAVVETGGRMIPNGNGNAWSGMMQIDGTVWGNTAAQMGFDLNTPEGQVGFAAAMLGGAVPGVSGSNWQERFINNYYPTGCMDCVGADGGTPRQYLQDIDRLTQIIYGAPQGGGMQAGQVPQGNVPISQAQLDAIGAGTGGVPGGGIQAVPNGGGYYPDVYGSGSGLPNGYNPGAGPSVQLDPATGKMVPVPGTANPQQNVINPNTGGGQVISSTPPDYAPLIQQAAASNGVPANILSALLQAESNWDPNAVNPSSGAQGLGQFMPETAAGLGITNPYDPAQAIDGAARYLKQMYDMFGSWDLALAAYNAGPGNVQKYGGIPPFPETQAYVQKINGLAGPVSPSGGPEVGMPTPTGPESGTTPLPTTGAERYPIVSGTLAPSRTPVASDTGSTANGPVPQGDGMGIYAGPNADESWMAIMFPTGDCSQGIGCVSTEYKQRVDLTYEPGCGCGAEVCDNCSYNSNTLYLDGASNTVHPGYDIAAPPGTPFAAPMGGTIIGTSSNASDPRCQSPGGTNECTWAYDNGVVMDGGTDVNGNPIYINYDHAVGTGDYADSLVGQYVDAGTQLGYTGDAAHIHVEIHGYCEKTGTMVVLDPSLVYGGYYQTHSACEGIA